MSYARFADDSSVYVFPAEEQGIVCFSCELVGRPEEFDDDDPFGPYFSTPVPELMIGHLLEHRARGSKVPARAIERLRREAA